MRLWRVLPWDPSATPEQPGHALWVPRALQGTGRHDAPDHYGCLYVSQAPVGAIAEMLAPFRGTGQLEPDLLVRSGRTLALAQLDLNPAAVLIDLDDPTVLTAEGLRPSIVATSHRQVTQAYALEQFRRHPDAAGLRWWSTLEASWLQVTLFDRAIAATSLGHVRELTLEDGDVLSAAAHLGLA